MRTKTSFKLCPLQSGTILLLALSACTPNDNSYRVENEALKKQLAKQESLLSSLQDGNKIMQQQIDLLNQEIRDAKSTTEATKQEVKLLTEQLEAQEVEAKQAVATQIAQSLKFEEKGAHSDTLSYPLPAVAKIVEEALTRNGYQLKVSVKTDQKAIYVTERKASKSRSLEAVDTRNQFLISLQALPDNLTKLGVKADYEKVAQGGRILSVSAEETTEIERGLIREVSKVLETPKKT